MSPPEQPRGRPAQATSQKSSATTSDNADRSASVAALTCHSRSIHRRGPRPMVAVGRAEFERSVTIWFECTHELCGRIRQVVVTTDPVIQPSLFGDEC